MTNTKTLTLKEAQDIDQRALKVSSLLKRSAQLWLEIATEVNDAKVSLCPISYNLFLNKAGLTNAIADKLLRIAKDTMLYSDIVKPHINKLEGWSTLYEVAKLSPKEKQSFFDTLNQEPETTVSRAFIQSFKASKPSLKSTELPIVQISIDKNNISRFSYDQFLNLKDKLDDIAHIVDKMSPAIYLKVNDTNVSIIETHVSNATQNQSLEPEEHGDELLPITIPAANSDCNVSHVAF